MEVTDVIGVVMERISGESRCGGAGVSRRPALLERGIRAALTAAGALAAGEAEQAGAAAARAGVGADDVEGRMGCDFTAKRFVCPEEVLMIL
jgi:hypothetical protein